MVALPLVTPWLRESQKGGRDFWCPALLVRKELVCWELLLLPLPLARDVAMTQSRFRTGGARGHQGTGAALLLTVTMGPGEPQLTVPKGKPALAMGSTAGLKEIMESWSDLVWKGP